MSKLRLIIWGVVILLVGVAGGWFLGRYTINTQLSQSEASTRCTPAQMKGGQCVTSGGHEICYSGDGNRICSIDGGLIGTASQK